MALSQTEKDILELLEKGVRSSVIAERRGVTRQAVSKVKVKLQSEGYLKVDKKRVLFLKKYKKVDKMNLSTFKNFEENIKADYLKVDKHIKVDKLTPSHPMNSQGIPGSPSGGINQDETSRDAIQRHVRRIVEKALVEVGELPQEEISKSMTPPHYYLNEYIKKILWRPNNYRKQVKAKFDREFLRKKIMIDDSTSFNATYSEKNKLLTIKDYKGSTIQVGRDYISSTYSQNIIAGHKETYLIEVGDLNQFDERISSHVEKIENLIDNSLKHFCKEFGIKMLSKPIWSRHEDWIKGEEVIDSLPRETIIHDTHFKKVYPTGIEFKGAGLGDVPGTKLKNFIKNRVLDEHEPLIASEIAANRDVLNDVLKSQVSLLDRYNHFESTFIPAMTDLGVNIKTHNKVLKDISRGFVRFNKLLSERQKRLGDWL